MFPGELPKDVKLGPGGILTGPWGTKDEPTGSAAPGAAAQGCEEQMLPTDEVPLGKRTQGLALREASVSGRTQLSEFRVGGGNHPAEHGATADLSGHLATTLEGPPQVLLLHAFPHRTREP